MDSNAPKCYDHKAKIAFRNSKCCNRLGKKQRENSKCHCRLGQTAVQEVRIFKVGWAWLKGGETHPFFHPSFFRAPLPKTAGCHLGGPHIPPDIAILSLRYPISRAMPLQRERESIHPKSCDALICCLVSHRHICAIPHFATYRAIIVRYSI